jgi:hypothetical protein
MNPGAADQHNYLAREAETLSRDCRELAMSLNAEFELLRRKINRHASDTPEGLESPALCAFVLPVGSAAPFIKLDAEVHRVRMALRADPKDERLNKELNGLIKAREKLLLDVQRKARGG